MTNDETNDKPVAELLQAAARRAVPVVRGTRDEQLGDRTPCAEYDVRALLNHLFQVVINFQALAARKDTDFSAVPDVVGEGGDWRERFEKETAALAEAWAAPGAAEGAAGSMGLPALTLARMALGDLTVHAWDLARATGQRFTPDPAAVADVLACFEELAPTARAWGVFADPFELPDPASASDFERLLAVTGRDPRWR
ncbi:TIGR03086 family metal-binding protein [Streptomyces sp. MUM 178J]|uniref:TIGR03086 family metal-binding protein n=1 Tax=Streptomyces sp. MUM 178J TaxID=2791991 RepID=UPI001F03CCFE|nr:TIGR03086 family metal-binding protein [Streptomyces sp. MUM 178J]WRQ82032.1 TIGR03086 family metal-binding protein [Streptomyces sp. MUM 178J]